MPYSRPASLPRRKLIHPPSNRQQPVFHFNQDDDSSQDDNDNPQTPSPKSSPLRISVGNHLDNKATLAPVFCDTVPFPRSSPVSPATDDMTSRAPPTRSSSHPIPLSCNKPLKSSLKSSSSTPNIPSSPRSLHLRAKSAPSTPGDLPVSTPKNVHFAEKDGLATVRVFNRSAKPCSLFRSLPGDDTETETESEVPSRPNGFPFPRISPGSSSSPLSPHTFEIDRVTPGATSPIPAIHPPPYANIHLESVELSYSPSTSTSARPCPVLSGSVLVRNLAYEKHVAVRFTLDNWQTTSEVFARYMVTVPDLPSAMAPRTPGDAAAVLAAGAERNWDRFSFSIRLEDYAPKLSQRIIWLVARFNVPFGEWWDNNTGNNYRIAFRPTSRRPLSLSAPAHLESASLTDQANKPHQNGQPDDREYLPLPSLTTSSVSPRGFSLQRPKRLSLSNYAAPSPHTMSPSASQDTQGPFPEIRSVLNPRQETPDKPNVATELLARSTIFGGHPASWTRDPPASGGEVGRKDVPRSFGGLAGLGAIALHWSWGSAGPAGSTGVERGPDEAEVVADFKPLASNEQNEPAGRFKKGLGGLVRGSPPPEPKDSSSAGDYRISPLPDRSRLVLSSGPGSLERDSVYTAFVRQWCFAEGPPPLIGGSGSGGLVVGG